jgi:hypothetical protein
MAFSMQRPGVLTGRFLEVFNSIHMNKANKAQIAKDSGWAILYRRDSAIVSRLIASLASGGLSLTPTSMGCTMLWIARLFGQREEWHGDPNIGGKNGCV